MAGDRRRPAASSSTIEPCDMSGSLRDERPGQSGTHDRPSLTRPTPVANLNRHRLSFCFGPRPTRSGSSSARRHGPHHARPFVQAGVRVTDDFVAGKLTLNARARPPVTSLRISRRARETVISCPVAHSGADGYERLESCSALLVVLRSPVASRRPGCRRILSGYALRRESALWVRGARRTERAARWCVYCGCVWLTGVPRPLASGSPGYS